MAILDIIPDQPYLNECPCCGHEVKMEYFKKDGLAIRCYGCFLKMEQRTLRNGHDWLKGVMSESWNKRVTL